MYSRFVALALFALVATPALAQENFKPTNAQRDACLDTFKVADGAQFLSYRLEAA